MFKILFVVVVAVTANAGVWAAVAPAKPAQGRALMHPELRAGQGQQVLQCYEGVGQTGDSVRLIDYASDLSQYNFNDRATSCCFNGIWILFDETNYNQNNLKAPTFYAWGENYCTNLDSSFARRASSARHSGAPDGYKFDTINFYDGEYFMGREQYLYQDAPQLNYDNLGRSLIVTGGSPWTLYQYDNYQGNCFCVYPADMASQKPGFYPTESTLGGLSQQVSSARRGCFCTRKIFAHKTFTRDGEISHQGFFGSD